MSYKTWRIRMRLEGTMKKGDISKRCRKDIARIIVNIGKYRDGGRGAVFGRYIIYQSLLYSEFNSHRDLQRIQPVKLNSNNM